MLTWMWKSHKNMLHVEPKQIWRGICCISQLCILPHSGLFCLNIHAALYTHRPHGHTNWTARGRVGVRGPSRWRILHHVDNAWNVDSFSFSARDAEVYFGLSETFIMYESWRWILNEGVFKYQCDSWVYFCANEISRSPNRTRGQLLIDTLQNSQSCFDIDVVVKCHFDMLFSLTFRGFHQVPLCLLRQALRGQSIHPQWPALTDRRVSG